MDKCGRTDATPDHRRQQRALRLIFEQRGNDLKLMSTQRLNMVVPPPQSLVQRSGTLGSWFELRDGRDMPVYRRAIVNPLQDIEVVADEPGEPLHRIDTDLSGHAFHVIVPDIAGARRLVLHVEPRTSSRAAGSKSTPASATHEFDLSDADKGAQ